VVATVKSPGLEGVKLLVIQPLDRHCQPVGGQLVAADAVHMAGPGELVYFVAAREAAQAMPDPFRPRRSRHRGDRGRRGHARRGDAVKIGRVVGTVVSTINAPASTAGRSCCVTSWTRPEHPAGGYLIAVDSVGAGAGETVLILDEGNSARQVLAAPGAPIRTVVVRHRRRGWRGPGHCRPRDRAGDPHGRCHVGKARAGGHAAPRAAGHAARQRRQ